VPGDFALAMQAMHFAHDGGLRRAGPIACHDNSIFVEEGCVGFVWM